MIFVTGDTHGNMDIQKLNTDIFPEQHALTKKDFVIVAGDFGGVWHNNKKDNYILDWHNKKNYTTLFVDGNHENFDALEKYPVVDWNGGKVQFIRENIIHLMRGQVYTIEGRKFFTFGGAQSIDKQYRQEHISWWSQEIPSYAEVEEGFSNLSRHNWKVDVVITHTSPTRFIEKMNMLKLTDPTCKIMDEFDKLVKFNVWLFGHYHVDMAFEYYKYFALYNEKVLLDFTKK